MEGKITMRMKRLLFCILALVWVSAIIVTAQQDNRPRAEPYQEPARSQTRQPDGALVFKQHCSRCHNAPEGFSPRISGTIVRHMRVRASLSKSEEEQLLRFLNP
jgi:cytochrome c5